MDGRRTESVGEGRQAPLRVGRRAPAIRGMSEGLKELPADLQVRRNHPPDFPPFATAFSDRAVPKQPDAFQRQERQIVQS